MSEILGHDIDGKPLRAGDRVGPADPDMKGWSGRQPTPPWTVLDRCGVRAGGLRFVEMDSDGDKWGAPCAHLRKLPPKQDTTTWEAIQEMTGWSPVAQPVKPC